MPETIAPPAPKQHPAGTAQYRGDVRSIVGEIKGPTTFGTPLVASAAEYDPATDTTTVAFLTLPPELHDAATRDADGTWRLEPVTAAVGS